MYKTSLVALFAFAAVSFAGDKGKAQQAPEAQPKAQQVAPAKSQAPKGQDAAKGQAPAKGQAAAPVVVTEKRGLLSRLKSRSKTVFRGTDCNCQ